MGGLGISCHATLFPQPGLQKLLPRQGHGVTSWKEDLNPAAGKDLSSGLLTNLLGALQLRRWFLECRDFGQHIGRLLNIEPGGEFVEVHQLSRHEVFELWTGVC